MKQPTLTEIDLSKTTRKGGSGLEEGPTYLVLYHGSFYTGSFSREWYGLSFNAIFPSGVQYDPPPTNYSAWQRIWRIEGTEAISKDAEPQFMAQRRRYAIDHKIRSNGTPIDESAPLEAFAYLPNVPAMPKDNCDDDC